jgi:SRSO17 transposase
MTMKKTDVEKWAEELDRVAQRIGPQFARSEPRHRAMRYIQGLLSTLKRKNGWQLAEQAGDETPDGMQRLLNNARWDEAGLRDDVRAYAIETLGEAEGILVVDETGFLKKGTKSVGVKRQYSGTAGRIENCQIGVFLGYASSKGRTLIDRELYLPQEWAADQERRQEAGVPEPIQFQTKPQLAQRMLARAFDANIPVQWVTADTVYGGDRSLRLWLEEEGHWFVMAVGKAEPLWRQLRQTRADKLAAQLTETDWVRLSCGEGAKGPRLYDWALIALPRWQQPADVFHALLVRRRLTDGELAYYVVFAPSGVDLSVLVQVAGSRWTVEESIEIAKDDLGLDEYEVRRWRPCYRHMTLVMVAQAFLNTVCLKANSASQKKHPATTHPALSVRNSTSALKGDGVGQTVC